MDTINQTSESSDDLVLLHGFPTSSMDYADILPYLQRKFRRIVLLDYIGFGFSDKPLNHRYSIFEYATIVESLMNHIGLSRYHVLAHDMGVTVGQEMLVRFVERKEKKDVEKNVILSMCFLNGGLFPEQHKPLVVQKLALNNFTGKFVSRFFNYYMFMTSFRKVFGTKNPPTEYRFREFWNVIKFNDGNKITHKTIKYITDRKENRDRWVNILNQTAVKQFIIFGAQDPVSGEHAYQYYKENVHQPIAILLNTVGHYPQIEDPESMIENYFLHVPLN